MSRSQDSRSVPDEKSFDDDRPSIEERWHISHRAKCSEAPKISKVCRRTVIDEACQSTEPACWIPLAHCKRVVLAGDHCQLPPTVLSRPALDDGLGISLLERLVEHFGTLATRRLQVQYRMHEAIMAFSARWFYRDDLRADAAVARHVLSELPGVTSNDLTNCPLHFIDTAGASFEEECEAEGDRNQHLQQAREMIAIDQGSANAIERALIAENPARSKEILHQAEQWAKLRLIVEVAAEVWA